MFKKLCLSLIIGGLSYSHSVFAQATQEHIVQPIIINGQQAQGIFVVQNGSIQPQTCASPQQYVTVNQSSSGWACFDQSTGTWLLYARPPLQTAAPPQQGPTIVYSQPTPVYIPTPTPDYSYPYSYYPYSYPYFGYPYAFGPSFGLGFGFGFGSPFFVNRTFVGRPFIGRPFVGRPFVGRSVAPFAASRSFGGFRQGSVRGGFGRGGGRR